MPTKITSLIQAQAQQDEAMAKLAEVRDYLSEQVHDAQMSDEDPIPRRDADLWTRLSVWYSTLSDAMHAIDPRFDEQAGPRRPLLRLVEPDE